MSLLMKTRTERLKDVFGHTAHRFISPLALAVPLTTGYELGLRTEARMYYEASRRHGFVNVTPNGMMMPKKEIEHLFTSFSRFFFITLMGLGVFDRFKAWNVPAIRYKEPNLSRSNAQRPRASEHAHSDSWLGWDQSAIVFMLPLLGDVERNWVQFFDHPLDDEWIKVLPSFTCAKARKLLNQCVGLPWDYQVGCLYPNDIGCVHQTRREPGSGWRVSCEVVGYLEEPDPDSFGVHTAFSATDARDIVRNIKRFEAKLNMGEIGEYDKAGRAISVQLVDVS